MSNFKEFLKGKRVVLVGPASTLWGTGMGAFIDSHDVVVRLNHSWPLPEQLKVDIGSRTDVLYHNLNPNNQRIRRRHVVRMHEDGVKWLILSHPTSRIPYRRRYRRFRRVNKGLLKSRAIPNSLKVRLRRRVGSSNTGLVAIVDLLRFPIDYLYVTGFSFYTTKYLSYPNYKQRFRKKALRHHNQRKHKKYLARLVAREERLEVDPYIAYLLERYMPKGEF